LQLVAQTANGHSARDTGIVPLTPAQHRALDEAFLREHLGKLGGTPFYLEAVTLDSAEPLFVPVSEVKALRRQVVKQLMALQTSYETPQTYRVVADTLAQLQPSVALPTPAQVHVLVRTPEQLEAALVARPASITLDYLELYGLKPSVERVKAAGIRCRVASPRILKPTEHNILRFCHRLTVRCSCVRVGYCTICSACLRRTVPS
jgi:putative protease